MEDNKIRVSEISFPSSDGRCTVKGKIYEPDCSPMGVIMLAHGMIDHVGRYDRFARRMCSSGFVFAAHNHLGHGETAPSSSELGFIADKNGDTLLVEDVLKMNRLLSERFSGLPIILFGHSMGSFIARIYAVKYPDTVSGVVIHGTGGPNPLVGLGRCLAGAVSVFKGSHCRSKLIGNLAFGSYNKKFDENEGFWAWLTSDPAQVSDRNTDPFASYAFTASGYRDLFTLVRDSNSRGWFKSYPLNMPTLIVSGEDDPVGDFGKGPRTVYQRLAKEGVSPIELKMYNGARHELFNERCSEEFYAHLEGWIKNTICERQ